MSTIELIPSDLQPAYAACRELTRIHARNFYYGLRLTPEPKRSAVYAIYAWMRVGDDAVDDPGTIEDRSRRLETFIANSERVLSGRAVEAGDQTPYWAAFADTLSRFPLDRANLRSLIDGLRHDLKAEAARSDPPRPMHATRGELEQYCYCVASVVGLICVDVWGLRDPSPEARQKAAALAVQRGLAFQLTNILRDYSRDYLDGRIYLPSDDFARDGLSPKALLAWENPRACEATIGGIAAWARACYDGSAGLEQMIDPACSPTLWTMTRIYSRLLEKIAANPRRVVGEARVRVRAAHKAGIVLRALVQSRTLGWNG